jgi:hypothetical protein
MRIKVTVMVEVVVVVVVMMMMMAIINLVSLKNVLLQHNF